MKSGLPIVKSIDFTAFARSSSDGHPEVTGILLRSGAAEFSLERRFRLRAGELYVIPARAPHAFIGALDQRTQGWVFNLGEQFDRVPSLQIVSALSERQATDLGAWLDRIEVERNNGDACSTAMSQALYNAVSIECARVIGVAGCSKYSRRVSSALQIISKEYASALRPRDIAERVGVTPAHLSHEVRRMTGRTPSEWISRARIDAAKLLLLTCAHTVSAIAMSVGYADVSQLNRQFRQATGMSPHAWRRANKASHSTN
jgi:AraC-like DNA-binding protein